jgi:cation diffusion facilitator family transporter
VATLAVLIGCLVEVLLNLKVDGIVGLAVAVFILWSGFSLAKETVSLLLGQRADRALVEQIESLVLLEGHVRGLHDLLVHDYGPGQCFASVHVQFDPENSALECHRVIDAIERKVLAELNVHLVIHFDPENDME